MRVIQQNEEIIHEIKLANTGSDSKHNALYKSFPE